MLIFFPLKIILAHKLFFPYLDGKKDQISRSIMLKTATAVIILNACCFLMRFHIWAFPHTVNISLTCTHINLTSSNSRKNKGCLNATRLGKNNFLKVPACQNIEGKYWRVPVCFQFVCCCVLFLLNNHIFQCLKQMFIVCNVCFKALKKKKDWNYLEKTKSLYFKDKLDWSILPFSIDFISTLLVEVVSGILYIIAICIRSLSWAL